MLSSNTSAVSGDTVYVEDVFSTYLYTGAGTAQTITNNIDLSTKGGLVWIKNRGTGTTDHQLVDTARGAYMKLASNITNGQASTSPDGISAFNTTGFSIGGNYSLYNTSGSTYASWTFRKQPKFFDVVTYTGNGTAGRTVAHSLGAVPGCMIVRPTSAVDDWFVYHRSLLNSQSLFLNLTAAASSTPSAWNSTTPTSTEFTVGTNTATNANGVTYVAYLFAHDAGGFGLTGTDNVISCGSYTGNGSATGPTVTLGYEPQWLLVKRASGGAENWHVIDNMRGFAATGNVQRLYPNLSNAEDTGSTLVAPTATGFNILTSDVSFNTSGNTYIYIAIRRGPMKVPTDGTTVFASSTYTGTGTSQTVTSGLQTAGGSLVVIQDRTAGSSSRVYSGLRGVFQEIYTQSTAAEVNRTSLDAGLKTFNMNGFSLGSYNYNGTNQSGITYVGWQFRRAPSFFDEVCYTGTGAIQNISHNLGVTPTLILTKTRTGVYDWLCYSETTGTSNTLFLNLTDASTAYTSISAVSSTTFTVPVGLTNTSGDKYVAYLFATCAGVSKVGSYTGTGTTKQVDCGFAAGARFVLIKRTDSTGGWYVWDTARGIVSGNDPYLLLNSTAAEVTSTDYIDTYSAGFELSSTAPAALNASGGTYIFLAIA